jgi:membrane-bound ClpP family serine protease
MIKSSSEAAYFAKLSLPFFLLGVAGLYWIQMMILAVILLFSSMMRGGFPVLLLTLCYYFICNGLPVVRESFKEKTAAEQSKAMEALLQWLTAIFPDFSWLDFKTLTVTNDPIPAHIAMPFAQATLYITIALWIACSIYKRRDLQ